MRVEDKPSVLLLRVGAAQTPFVEPIAETLVYAGAERDNHVLEMDDRIVGFFQIETENLGRFKGSSRHELELHEFFIDTAAQGCGAGSFFVNNLKAYLLSQYVDWLTVSLSVNCRNQVAYDLYKKGGFVDTGEIWLEGRSGPQHVMQMELR